MKYLIAILIISNCIAGGMIFEVSDKNGKTIKKEFIQAKERKIVKEEPKEPIDPYEEDKKIIYKALNQVKEQHKKILGTKESQYHHFNNMVKEKLK